MEKPFQPDAFNLFGRMTYLDVASFRTGRSCRDYKV
jgi:hypothetical protein